MSANLFSDNFIGLTQFVYLYMLTEETTRVFNASITIPKILCHKFATPAQTSKAVRSTVKYRNADFFSQHFFNLMFRFGT